MDTNHLEENLIALLTDINKARPKREGRFVTRVILSSPPSSETLKIDPFVYIPEERIITTTDTSKQATEEDADAEEKAEATN